MIIAFFNKESTPKKKGNPPTFFSETPYTTTDKISELWQNCKNEEYHPALINNKITSMGIDKIRTDDLSQFIEKIDFSDDDFDTRRVIQLTFLVSALLAKFQAPNSLYESFTNKLNNFVEKYHDDINDGCLISDSNDGQEPLVIQQCQQLLRTPNDEKFKELLIESFQKQDYSLTMG